MNFKDISYLSSGNPKQVLVHKLLKKHKVMRSLDKFDPILTGTIPIGVDTDHSDLDIICYWKNRSFFVSTLVRKFMNFPEFNIKNKIIGGQDTVIASFCIDVFRVEIFGQNRPVTQQEAYRHMLAEFRILKLQNEDFRQKILTLKSQGIKTEPAFCDALGIKGNPYEEILKYSKD